MKNSDQPAYPCQKFDGITNPKFPGLTKREMFAMHAPIDIPSWFSHVELPRIPEPKSWTDMAPDDPFKEEARQWHQDRSYDIASEELQWFQQAWEKFWEEKVERDHRDFASRLKQWRYYYADLMLNEELP